MQRWCKYGDMAKILSCQCDQKTCNFCTPKDWESKCSGRFAPYGLLHQQHSQKPEPLSIMWTPMQVNGG